MATTTSNFGWPIPQSTDLVKDGATAIASLGSGVDTSMAELKGGTTGQILSKTSNTDMDFTWITPNPGDITGVTAGTGITGGGTSGDVTVSFDVANYGGGQYAAGKNKIINGDFGINQRGFTNSPISAYTFDRWRTAYNGGTCTYSAQTFTLGAAPVSGYEATNNLQMVTASQSAASDYMSIVHRIESVRTLAGQTATVSFWAKATTGTPSVAANFLQLFGSGGSPSSAVVVGGQKTAITSSWARYSFTFSIPSISGKTIGTDGSDNLQLEIFTSAGSDYNTRSASLGIQNVTIQIWGVQVEAGSTATPFQTATGTKQGELDACQRYYWRGGGDSTYNPFGNGLFSSSTNAYITIPNPVNMRVKPTSIDYSTLAVFDGTTNIAVTSVAENGSGRGMSYITATIASGGTANRPCYMTSNNSTSGYIGFSAEL